MNKSINNKTNAEIDDNTLGGIVQSNNFLGLLPLPYSLSTFKSSLPLLQTTTLSFADTHIPQTSTNNKNNSTYTSSSSTTTHLQSSFDDLNNFENQSKPMSSSTFRGSSFSMAKPSLFNQSREKERFELSTLNDKFADYVEKVRYLEAQNKKIQMDANLLTEKEQENCQKIKSKYETEIAQLRQTAEKLFKDKNSTFSTAQETQNTIVPLKQRLNQTFRECDSSKYDTEKVERQLSSVEGDIIMFKRRLAHQDNEHNQWKQLIAQIQRFFVQTKNEIQTEIITRSSCEQKSKQLQDEIVRLREQQQQKLKDIKQSAIMSGSTTTNDRAHTFKSELSNAIRRIRQDFEREHDAHRNELYGQFQQSYQNIARQYPELGHLFLNDREQERIKQEEDRVRADIQRVRTDMNALKQKTSELKLQLRELQIKIEMTTDENQRLLQSQQNEMNQFKLHNDKATQDYEDVIHKQTSLEKEIETYRNLLEGTMKPVVDNITDDFNTKTANQVTVEKQQDTTATRTTYTPNTDRLSSKLNYRKTNDINFYGSYNTLYPNNKSSENTTTTTTTTVIDIPVTRFTEDSEIKNQNSDVKTNDNEQHIVEVEQPTDDSSSINI
ncbi:unnamed protein product [Adineta steineri]|uniref:IF rod domain-containing protein n=1 Tax=Adineta steineri TaxID=433720 RepID=A0A813UMZ2_9BILA|nr:unnamed protein product [Adineta steineri]